MSEFFQCCCAGCCVTCILMCCECERGLTLYTRRKLVDLPPQLYLKKDKYNNGCYFANIMKLLEYDPYNITFKNHMDYAMQMNNYIVRLIPHSNNKYQVWNASSEESRKIDIEVLKNFHGDLLFPWYRIFPFLEKICSMC